MTRIVRASAPTLTVLVALVLAGCATAPTDAGTNPAPDETTGVCGGVTVVVDFGPLDEPSLGACSTAGAASDILVQVGITTEGTVDYGDQVVCRVNDQPSPDEEVTIEGAPPFVESCQTLNAAAYWALWVKNDPESQWEYAQEGVNTLELSDGQSVGLVYTPGTESIPPRD